MIDVPLLRKELQFVTDHQDRWRQRVWLAERSCGTVGCLAGNTLLHAGQVSTAVNDEGVVEYYPSTSDYWRDAAATVLGLDEEQAHRLFSGSNTLHDLWCRAREFTDGEIEIPLSVDQVCRPCGACVGSSCGC